jgi:hypothetical protein
VTPNIKIVKELFYSDEESYWKKEMEKCKNIEYFYINYVKIKNKNV